MLFKMTLLSFVTGMMACTDQYPIPSVGGQYCDLVGTVSDGQNCWGSCINGCPPIRCPSGTTCYFETRAVSTEGACIWPANTKLCCAHISDSANGDPSFGMVVTEEKNYSKVDIGSLPAGTPDKKEDKKPDAYA